MATRSAKAQWNGDLKAGKGSMEFGSGAFKGNYSFSSRFESGTGTNPEELIAAAHAGCFSMAFSNELAKAGFTPTSVNTTAKLDFNNTSGAWTIARIDLETEGDVPGIDDAKFQEIAQGAKKNCPVSRALASVPEINVHAKLLTKELA